MKTNRYPLAMLRAPEKFESLFHKSAGAPVLTCHSECALFTRHGMLDKSDRIIQRQSIQFSDQIFQGQDMTVKDQSVSSKVRITLENQEHARCSAIVAGDRESLGMLLDDSLVHVHGTGLVDDKDGYLRGIGGKYLFHFVERGPLTLREAGSCVVMIGDLFQSFTDIRSGIRYTVKGIVTQVWKLQSDTGAWRQLTCHNSFLETSPKI